MHFSNKRNKTNPINEEPFFCEFLQKEQIFHDLSGNKNIYPV